MSIAHVQERLFELAKAHHAIDDPGLDELKDAEIIEAQAMGLILDHCRSQSHLPDKAVPMAAQQRVLDRLALEKDDVAELMWFYTSHFWPGTFENRQDYLDSTRDLLLADEEEQEDEEE